MQRPPGCGRTTRRDPATGVDDRPAVMIMCPVPRTILIADDDPHIRQLLVFAFAKAGLDTVEAADGEATLAAVAERAPDLVVLDINMRE